jgi:hypothetical protein
MTRSIEVEVTGTSRLEVLPVQVREDADQFIVGRPATGSYLALSAGALAATELLSDGRTIAETKAALAREDAGREVRLRPLLETLLAAGMVRAVDGAPLPEALPPRRYHLTFLRRRHVAWAFSRPAAAVYLTLVGLGVGIVLTDPGYFPRAAHALVASDPVLNLTLLWGVSLVAMAMHELAHLMAAAFLGVQASFALSHRLFFAVAQTDLTDLWLVARRKRYLAYAAGMVNDLVMACAAVSALWLHDQQLLPLPDLAYSMLRLAVLVLLLGVVWQFNFYLRTDVYYLVANFTGCRNLSEDAKAYLKSLLPRLFTGAQPKPLAALPARERRIVRGFAALMVIGTALVVAVGAVYLGALLWLVLGGLASLPGGGQAPNTAPAGLFPALASLGLTCCWLAYAIVRKRRRRPRVRYHLIGPEDL